MTARSGYQANETPISTANSPGSDLVNRFIGYYSNTEGYTAAAATAATTAADITPAPSSVSATPPAAALLPMQRDNSSEPGNQSTDSDHNGAGSSESSSSLGDSAAAAARVLAAWQDRAAATGSGGAPGSGPLSDGASMWSTASQGAAGMQSSNSTPRHNHSAFNSHAREGSAPVTGTTESNQRRPDMGFLALLNSAAAFVAESSGAVNSASSMQSVENPYIAHNELLSGAPLTLSGINSSFSQVPGNPGDEQSNFTGQYGTPLTRSAYQDFAQALQHIAATTTGTEGSAVPSGMVEPQSQPPFGSQPYSQSGGDPAGTMTATAIRPEQIMSAENQSVPENAALASGSHINAAVHGSGGSKRKRRDPGNSSFQTPAKRKSSHASDRSSKGATPHSGEVRRAARKWTDEETENLLQGCSKYGVGAWKKILDDPNFSFNNRTSVDLKDRFRTIRAQECAHSVWPKNKGKSNGKEPDVVWPLPPNSQRLQGLHRVQRKPTRNYTRDEDRRLLIGVLRHANHWTKIAADPDLKLNDRPGQSLRDRLRNAFPTVFELFGYVIPKKERADRERHSSTPAPQTAAHQAKQSTPTPKRKAPTGSKRLEGEVPGNIKEQIMSILNSMNASLDPHPIPEDDADSSYDADADADADADKGGMDAASAMPPTRAPKAAAGDGADVLMSEGSTASPSHDRKPRARSGTLGLAASIAADGPAEAGGTSSQATTGKGRKPTGRKKTPQKRVRSKSKLPKVDSQYSPKRGTASTAASAAGPTLDTSFSGAVANDGGIHSAPAQVDNANGGGRMGDLGAFSDTDQRRPETVSASPFGPQRQYLLDSFAPSVFSRPIGPMTPTDQLDALALEGRMGSGYSTPTQSMKRRHSVQADINDAMAAAAAVAAGIERSNFTSALHFLNSGVGALDHASATTNNSAMQPSTEDTIRRMTVDGSMGADAFLFPRLPEEDAAAAAAAAGMAAQMGASRSVGGNPTQSSSGAAGLAENASADHSFKTSVSASAESAASATATMTTQDLDGRPDFQAGYRGQLRSAQRLLRANGVADDNSIGLSTTTSGDSRVDLEALAQFSQWFPNFSPANLGWNIADASSQLGGESIDPNMLDAGLSSAAAIVAAAANGAGNDSNSNTSSASNLAVASEANTMHARRRSQFDWYGLTPSLAAALNAANTAPQPAPENSNMPSLNPFALTAGAVPASYRRPSMPIFPSFAYTQSDMLNLSANHMGNDSSQDPMTSGGGGSGDQVVYSTSAQESSNMVAAAAAAAAAVVAALGDNSEGLETTADPSMLTTAAVSRGYGSGAVGTMANDGSGAKQTLASGSLSIGGDRPRAANDHGRRRTMHVPPSLLEGVATSEFGDDMLSGATGPHSTLTSRRSRRDSLYPPRPANGLGAASAAAAGGVATTRIRRSRTIGSNHSVQKAAGLRAGSSFAAGGGAVMSMGPPSVPQMAISQCQVPALPPQQPAVSQQQQPQPASLGGTQLSNVVTTLGAPTLPIPDSDMVATRHTRSYSGTQFPHDALSALVSAGIDGSKFSLAGTGFVTAAPQASSALPGLAASSSSTPNAALSGSVGRPNLLPSATVDDPSSVDSDLEAMASLGGGGSMDVASLKQSLWSAGAIADDDGGLHHERGGGMHDETRSLTDVRRVDSSSLVDLYRPASSTPTGRVAFSASGAAGAPVRTCSPNLVSQSAPTVSPVAPRSTASTPGRREAVGI